MYDGATAQRKALNFKPLSPAKSARSVFAAKFYIAIARNIKF